MKHLKIISRVFGFLDILSFIRNYKMMIALFGSIAKLDIYSAILNLAEGLFLISLPFSAVAFLTNKRWGCWLYYIQFPFRIFFLILSFGFIIYLNVVLKNQALYYLLIGIAVVCEFLRLFFVVKINRRLDQG